MATFRPDARAFALSADRQTHWGGIPDKEEMMDHLRDAELHIERAVYGNIDRSQFNALLAIAYALIGIAKRLPPPAEPQSECHKRLREEEKDGI